MENSQTLSQSSHISVMAYAKMTKATGVLNAGNLATNVPSSWKHPEFPQVQTFQLQ